MDFSFSKDEELWQWAVKDFADREIASKEMPTFDHAFRGIVKKMGDLGFLGVGIPEEYGGDPASWVMLGILVEEIAKVSIGVAYFAILCHEVATSLAFHGSAQVRQEWLPGLISGDKIGSISVTEPQAGTDFGAINARAEKVEDGYLITGEKGPVSFGMEADMSLVFLQTGPGGIQGVTAMAVPLTAPGVARLGLSGMGLSASAPALLRFTRTPISRGCLIGEEGGGHLLNRATGLQSGQNQILSGLLALGAAQRALKLAIRYAKERSAFGRPIAKYEAISNKIAEDATQIEAGRWLCYRALSLKDRNLPSAKEAAMSGWWCPRISYQVIQDGLLVHGHAGYCDDHPFQEMLRDIVAFETISGTEQILKLIISRELIGSAGIPDSLTEHIGNL